MPNLRFSFFSSCPEVWGGSEELWAGAARRLALMGHRVHTFKVGVDRDHPKIRELVDAGCRVTDLCTALYPLHVMGVNRLFLPYRRWWRPEGGEMEYLVIRHLKKFAPHLTIFSQAENFDGVYLADACRRSGQPYVLVCQKASDYLWPTNERRNVGIGAFRCAVRAYFVSRRNQELTERMLGESLTRAEVVCNPVLAGGQRPVPWPAPVDSLKLACVARFFVLDKGQDLLLDVLARPHWRRRPLQVSFFGRGRHREAMMGRARQLNLASVEFPGHKLDIEEIWRTHHALILPSRAEGLPLAALEAMSCGRPCILTDVGGNAELAGDSQVGFLAAGASVNAIDKTLETVWHRRDQLKGMGRRAADYVRKYVGPEPIQRFADLLLQDAEVR